MLLVTGASGNVGTELIRALLSDDENVRALTRGTHPPALPAGVQAVAGDLNRPDSLTAALAGVHGVFLLSGYADMPALLSAIRDAGVQRVVLLSSGAVIGGDVSNAVVHYNVLSEAAVRESGVLWTILRPSGFYSNALQWVTQLRDGDVVREPFADVPIAAIDPFDIAAVAALALTRPGHEGADPARRPRPHSRRRARPRAATGGSDRCAGASRDERQHAGRICRRVLQLLCRWHLRRLTRAPHRQGAHRTSPAHVRAMGNGARGRVRMSSSNDVGTCSLVIRHSEGRRSRAGARYPRLI